MTTLKRCPCGEIPESFGIEAIQRGKGKANAVPSCCGKWRIRFDTQYLNPHEQECHDLAYAAWNDAPRGGDDI